MKPNWFIGLVAEAGVWFPQRLGEAPPGVRLFAPGDLHFTVAFLGGCHEEQARAAWSHSPEWPLPPTRVSLGEVVPMGSPKRYSALSALLVEGRQAIESAIGEVRDAMQRSAGAKADRRAPKAHLTLGRLRRTASRAQREGALVWADRLDLAGIELRLDRLALYTWAADRQASLFQRVETLCLRGSAADPTGP